RIVFLLSWLLFAATALLLEGIVSRLAPRRHLPGSVALAYGAAVFVLLLHFNGLEKGCELFLIAATGFYVQRAGVERPGRVAVLGVLLGLGVLARVDVVFLVGAWCALELLSRRPIAERLLRAGVVAAIAVAVSSPWWLYNLATTGRAMPSSGQAEMAWEL